VIRRDQTAVGLRPGEAVRWPAIVEKGPTEFADDEPIGVLRHALVAGSRPLRDLPNAGGRNRSPACCYADEAHGDRSDLSQAEHKPSRAGALDLLLSRRDNVFVERLWRSVKYEEVYLRAYESVAQARASIGSYLRFYNSRRPHSSLDRADTQPAVADRSGLNPAGIHLLNRKIYSNKPRQL
jgi:hypothetical protein